MLCTRRELEERVLPTSEEPLAAQLGASPGALLTGDLGLVALRALLENGVGYVVGAWQEEPTPLDTVLQSASGSVLARHGVVMRRLRSLAALQQVVTAPAPLVGAPEGLVAIPRGVVVFGGRRGMRGTLEAFTELVVPGGVVGFSFDEDATRIPGAVVVDPELTAQGLVEAIDAAMRASVALARPTLVLVRERLLGMRGTVRCRRLVAPLEAALLDAASPRSMTIDDSAAAAGLIVVEAPEGVRDSAGAKWIVVAGPLAAAARRALAAHEAWDVGLIELRAPRLSPTCPRIAAVLRDAANVLVLGGPGGERIDEFAACASPRAVTHAALDSGRAHGHQVAAAVEGWLGVRSRFALETVDARIEKIASRVPRRGEVLHRGIAPSVAAGLVLAQGAIGVPVRIEAEHGTYQTDTGVPLTVVDGATFAARGLDAAAPGTASSGVFVVTDDAPGAVDRARACGATVEFVDGTSPRVLGAALARACSAPRTAPHVVLATLTERIAAPRPTISGVDPDLLGTDRIATAAIPADATSVFEHDDGLTAGPLQVPLDVPQSAARLDTLRALSPASWDLRLVRRGGSNRWSDASWSMRRKLVRTLGGADL